MFLKRLQALTETVEKCKYTDCYGELFAEEALERAHALISETKAQGGIVYVVGNGGSAGIASHFCNDLLKTLQIPAQALYDSNILTCFSNDYGYEYVFSMPLKTLLRPVDLLVAISSSGRSANILNAVDVASQKGVRVITLSGFSKENPLRVKGDLNFWLGVEDYGLVETGHFSLLHTIIDLYCESYAKQN